MGTEWDGMRMKEWDGEDESRDATWETKDQDATYLSIGFVLMLSANPSALNVESVLPLHAVSYSQAASDDASFWALLAPRRTQSQGGQRKSSHGRRWKRERRRGATALALGPTSSRGSLVPAI